MEAREMNEAALTRLNEDYARTAIAKWSAVPSKGGSVDFLGGIKNPWMKRNMAILMENTSRNNGSIPGMPMNEATTTNDVAGFTKQSLGILRRAFPNLIANQIVSIQPQTSEFGVIGTLDRVYTNAKGAKVPATGITNDPTDMGYEGRLSAGDVMGANLGTNYSREFVDYDDLCADTGVGLGALSNVVPASSRLPAWSPIRANGTAGQRTFSTRLFYNVTDAPISARIATMTAAGVLTDQFANVVGSFSIATGQWTLNALTAAGAPTTFINNEVVYAQYYIQTELIGQTSGARLPNVNLSLTAQQVQAEPAP
jgi:hypothetical protein